MQELKQHFITTKRPYQEGAVEVFEQTIPAPARDVKKATLAITALGVYEAQLNGTKVGDVMFAPGYTYYPHNLHVQSYDVTSLLAGETAAATLRVYLGQGWYCGRFTCDNKTQIYGNRPAVAWVLTTEQADGTVRTVTSSDETVTVVSSPYGYAGFYDGEIYFAAGAINEAAAQIYPPLPYEGDLPDILEDCPQAVRLREEMPVQSVTKGSGVTILDFGQNFAGVVEIDPAKMNGNTLTLRHGEILNPDGSLYTANLRKAKAKIVYHKGTETQKYRPRFTYMGFRYAELSGVEYTDGLITAYALYSDMQRTGAFRCENKLVQKLYENQIWGQKSNYVEVPTDCPQRDERMGYTGDGHVFARTGAYNYDTEEFWDKFLKDIRYSQQDNTEGYVAPTIPAQGAAGIGFLTMLGWGNAVTIIPELLYWQYGTDEPLHKQYDSMKAHVECEIRHMGGLMGKKDLWIAPSLGDWLTMGKDVKYMAMHNGPVSNAFIVNDLRIMAWAARYLGKDEDAAWYEAQLIKTRAAYTKAFVKQDGSMKDDYQGAYIMALHCVLPQGALWDKVFARLLIKIKAEGMQTGFFATQHILPLLAEHGHAQLAYDLLLQEGCPGWMYQVQRGATTTWERWDALRLDGSVNETKMSGDNMVSFNHYAFGSVGEFYYRYILGIRPLEPGFAKVEICPYFDPRLGKVQGSYRSRAGEITVAWEYRGTALNLQITVPVSANVVLADGSVQAVSAGSHSFCF